MSPPTDRRREPVGQVDLGLLARVIWPRGFLGGAEFEFTLLVVCMALIATGSGKISLDGARTSRGVRSAGGSPWRIMR